MTQPCDSCGTPNENPTCNRCKTEQMRLGRNTPRPDDDKRHEQRVEDTRRRLTELPDLYAQLGSFILPGSIPPDPDGKRGSANPAWRSVVNLDVLDLTDRRLKGDADDTRTDYDLDRRAGARRQGVVNTLASWCRLVDEERRSEGLDNEPSDDPTIASECSYLLTHLDWYAAHDGGFVELHDDVKTMWSDVRAAVGERDRHADRFRCPQCSAEAVLVAGGFLSCTMSTTHDVSVRNLEGQYRRRPALQTKDVCAEFGVTPEQLRQWKVRRKIAPIKADGRGALWLPWDVFCVLNPDIRTAIDMRDAAEAG